MGPEKSNEASNDLLNSHQRMREKRKKYKRDLIAGFQSPRQKKHGYAQSFANDHYQHNNDDLSPGSPGRVVYPYEYGYSASMRKSQPSHVRHSTVQYGKNAHNLGGKLEKSCKKMSKILDNSFIEDVEEDFQDVDETEVEEILPVEEIVEEEPEVVEEQKEVVEQKINVM